MTDRADRIELLLHPDTRIGDPTDPSTWTIAGAPATDEQATTLGGITLSDAEDVITLLKLDLEISAKSEARQLIHDTRAFLAQECG